MKVEVGLGGLVGALVILMFSFGLLLVINGFSLDQIALPVNAILSLVIMFVSPVAGGFLAGLIAQEKPHGAGIIAGLMAGLVVVIAWLALMGIFWETLLSGLLLIFVWIFLSRLGAGFSRNRQLKS